MAPSRLLFILLSLVVVQTLSLLWWCQLVLSLMLPAALLVLLYAAVEWRRLQLMQGHLSTRERRWFWLPSGGEPREFTFHGELVLWQWLLVINGRDLQGRRLRLVLARDCMSRDDWRRLQVALRFSR
ncbi:hypothetical protein SAMN05216562_0956 [Microbulbifer marinus]|uniref:Uncharacterized protein n=1 Tax=Microbulbifer marinus TaxID=658218 RepID=A0A1H3WNK4_9GAMM|nr:protein YgfX [Microbulbifer marinus]SDZ87934.1 hypothetical protein SAMN05216562_0956 [Microbulbifer marinus]